MKSVLPLILSAIACGAPAAGGQSLAPVSSVPGKIALHVTETPTQDDLSLVANGQAADIYYDPADFKVVQVAADCLAADVERVTGKKPLVKTDAKSLSKQAVIIGTLGKNAVLDDLVRAGKIDTGVVSGQWESFVITTVKNPLPGLDAALVIAGSDRRGTAYGVFTVSEAVGVSPWVWWGDVPASRRSGLAIGATRVVSGPPSVKYRGIFINDEDWGLQPWAAKTFEPETNDIGPKTYAKVCELLLRLKANYLWPAMHESTKAFNHYPKNKEVADDHAIVMGSSHAEPMLRNNVDEWKPDVYMTTDSDAYSGAWDYQTNREGVLRYWEERVAANAKYENIYTIGMRGIHDSAMVGQKNMVERVAAMEDIFAQQRAMLAKYGNPQPELVPQNFVPYKEVLEIYRSGLKVPDDVTLVWVDDNHGYVRQLSNPEERKRGGGSGVYYHVSYWGAPEDYLWIDSTPLALIWEEMHKSYENGADRVWVLNVGDIKPSEIGMEFFLRMAWDITPWRENAQPEFLADWSSRTFGTQHAKDIAAVLDEYYRLNFPAKPEHLNLAKFTDNYGEIEQRLKRFSALVEKADAIGEALPKEKQDSFYELVLYRVRGSALANQMHLSKKPADALKAYDRLQVETASYNEKVAGGKWRHMMSANPRNRPALKKPKPATQATTTPAVETKASATPPPADGYISFEAERASRSKAGTGSAWTVIAGLGRSGDSIALLPTTATVAPEASLEYDFELSNATELKAVIYSLPTLPLYSGVQARYAVSIDGGEEQTVNIATAEYSKEWGANVLRAAAIHTGKSIQATPGKHTLKLRPLDPGLVFDKVVLDLGGLQPTHLGPPENPRAFSRAE